MNCEQWQKYALFSVFPTLWLVFCIIEDELYSKLIVKGKGSIEGFALFALETVQHGGTSLGEQVGDLLVGEQLARHLPEDRQGAGLVVALDHLGIEPHTALAALGTGKSGLSGAEKLF